MDEFKDNRVLEKENNTGNENPTPSSTPDKEWHLLADASTYTEKQLNAIWESVLEEDGSGAKEWDIKTTYTGEDDALDLYLLGENRSENRLCTVLLLAKDSQDEWAGWLCLAIVREYLCVTPLQEAPEGDRFQDILYLEIIERLRWFLDQKDYCYACDVIRDLIQYGKCLTNAGVRDSALYVLLTHPNMAYSEAKKVKKESEK